MSTAALSPARMAVRAARAEAVRNALNHWLAGMVSEIASKCPAVREFALGRSLRDSQYIEQTIGGWRRKFVR